MACRSSPRHARSAKTQTENHRFRRHIAVFVILIWGTSVSYLRQSALTGPTDKPLYERAGLHLWNPSSAFCLVQLANDSNQRSREFSRGIPRRGREKCGTVWRKKRNHSTEERINEWKGEAGLIKQIKERMSAAVSGLWQRAYCNPQRSSYLAGVSYTVSVFNPR